MNATSANRTASPPLIRGVETDEPVKARSSPFAPASAFAEVPEPLAPLPAAAAVAPLALPEAPDVAGGGCRSGRGSGVPIPLRNSTGAPPHSWFRSPASAIRRSPLSPEPENVATAIRIGEKSMALATFSCYRDKGDRRRSLCGSYRNLSVRRGRPFGFLHACERSTRPAPHPVVPPPPRGPHPMVPAAPSTS